MLHAVTQFSTTHSHLSWWENLLVFHNKLPQKSVIWNSYFIWLKILWVRNSEKTWLSGLWPGSSSWRAWVWKVHFQDGVFIHTSGVLVLFGFSLTSEHICLSTCLGPSSSSVLRVVPYVEDGFLEAGAEATRSGKGQTQNWHGITPTTFHWTKSHRACPDSRGWRNRLYLLIKVVQGAGHIAAERTWWEVLFQLSQQNTDDPIWHKCPSFLISQRLHGSNCCNIIVNMSAELMGTSWSQGITHKNRKCFYPIFIIALNKKYTLQEASTMLPSNLSLLPEHMGVTMLLSFFPLRHAVSLFS